MTLALTNWRPLRNPRLTGYGLFGKPYESRRIKSVTVCNLYVKLIYTALPRQVIVDVVACDHEDSLHCLLTVPAPSCALLLQHVMEGLVISDVAIASAASAHLSRHAYCSYRCALNKSLLVIS